MQIMQNRIRGPSNEVLFRAECTSFIKAIRTADAQNKVLVSNKRIGDTFAAFTAERSPLEDALPFCWTGTMTCHAEPGVSFLNSRLFSTTENAIIYTDKKGTTIVFPVNQEFHGVKDGILVAEHPEYRLVREYSSRYRVVAEKVSLVENFPRDDNDNGWYALDSMHGIPVGASRDPKKEKGLYTFEGRVRGACVCPITRGYSFNDPLDVYVIFETNLSTPQGAIVEAP